MKRDFYDPLKALLASSGLFKGTYELHTIKGEKIYVNREDLPIWEEYFQPSVCQVSIQDNLFKIDPFNTKIKSYFIKGTQQCITYRPKRENEEDIARFELIKVLDKSEKQVYSQYHEDGIIEKLLERIELKNRFIVEFGAYDGIKMSNSRYWIEQENWNAFLIEPDKRHFSKLWKLYKDAKNVRIMSAFVTPENITALFNSAEVPKDFEVLSIDIDSIDYYVWDALYDFQPKIVIIEYNSSYPPDYEYIVKRKDAIRYSGTAQGGSSILSLYKLGKKKGYNLIYGDLIGNNLYFIHDSCKNFLNLKDLSPEDVYQPPQFGLLSGGTAPNGRGYPPP